MSFVERGHEMICDIAGGIICKPIILLNPFNLKGRIGIERNGSDNPGLNDYYCGTNHETNTAFITAAPKYIKFLVG